MDFLDLPSTLIWQERQKWFVEVIENEQGLGSYLVSEQACALSIDLQIAFCAGAWISVIILGLTIIDAHLREVEIPGFKGSTADLIREANLENELNWLRKRRNKLIHINIENPEITVDEQWFKRDEFEDDARKVVKLVFQVMFLTPSV